jgi:hypothetical protein
MLRGDPGGQYEKAQEEEHPGGTALRLQRRLLVANGLTQHQDRPKPALH